MGRSRTKISPRPQKIAGQKQKKSAGCFEEPNRHPRPHSQILRRGFQKGWSYFNHLSAHLRLPKRHVQPSECATLAIRVGKNHRRASSVVQGLPAEVFSTFNAIIKLDRLRDCSCTEGELRSDISIVVWARSNRADCSL
jgi:hypothetical protein